MHFLLRFKVGPAPGTAMASLDCSRILLQPVQRLSAAVRKCLREVPLNTKPRCNQTAQTSEGAQAHTVHEERPQHGAGAPTRPLLLPPVAPESVSGAQEAARGPVPGQECPVIAASSCSLAPARHLSVVVSKTKHEPGVPLWLQFWLVILSLKSKSTSEMT